MKQCFMCFRGNLGIIETAAYTGYPISYVNEAWTAWQAAGRP